MDNLQRLIELAKADGGKFFVLDSSGKPVLVIMSILEYEKVLVKKLNENDRSGAGAGSNLPGKDWQAADIEEINKKILEAQKEQLANKKQLEQEQLKSEVIDSTFAFEPNSNIRQDNGGFDEF